MTVKYLIADKTGHIYTWVERVGQLMGGSNFPDYSGLTAKFFQDAGFDELTPKFCEWFASTPMYVNILHWQDDTQTAVPLYCGTLTGTPKENQQLIFTVDLSQVVSPIIRAESVYNGSPLLAFSVDGGVTWKGYSDGWVEGDMYLSNVHLLDETAMTELIGKSNTFKVRITLTPDSEFTSLTFIHKEENNA